jgi:hypothetical protein
LQEPSPFRRPTRREGRVTSDVMGGAGEKSEKPRRPARVRLWVAHASTVLLWTCFFVAFRELWAPSVLTMWPGCLTQPHVALRPSEAGGERAVALPPKSKLVASWFRNTFTRQPFVPSLVRSI